MSTVLVTGAGGGLGANVVRVALDRGHTVRALVRNPTTLPDGVEAIRGDALDAAVMRSAAKGCEAVFHLANVVIGNAWIDTTAKLLEAAIAACADGARLVFPANVWVYGRGTNALVDETAAHAPCSKLGHARAAKERAIHAAAIRWTMIRLPEFYGPHVQTLTGGPLRAIAQGKRGRWWGPADRTIEFVYMPDAAKVLVEVGLAPNVDAEVFHVPGVAHTTVRQFFDGRISVMPGRLAKLAGLVHPLARWYADILHLWEDPILLDGAKLRARFPELTMTSYEDGIAATLAWHRANADARVY